MLHCHSYNSEARAEYFSLVGSGKRMMHCQSHNSEVRADYLPLFGSGKRIIHCQSHNSDTRVKFLSLVASGFRKPHCSEGRKVAFFCFSFFTVCHAEFQERYKVITRVIFRVLYAVQVS